MVIRARGTLVLVVLALVLSALLPAVALATSKYTIVVGKGVGDARLGKQASYNISKLGKASKTAVDANYPNPFGKGRRTVYIYYWGKRMSGGRYPLCMYAVKTSAGSKTVFNFTAYGKAYKTSKAITVGSTESALKAAYPTASRKAGSVYTRYVLGKGPYTEFWVKGGKVFSITVRR